MSLLFSPSVIKISKQPYRLQAAGSFFRVQEFSFGCSHVHTHSYLLPISVHNFSYFLLMTAPSPKSEYMY